MSDRILIVKLSSIGDVIMASPIARVLRKAKPDAYIAWVVEPKSADMVIGNPYLDEVIVWHRQSSKGTVLSSAGRTLGKLSSLARDLRKKEFDIAIDAQGLLRSALVSLFSGAKCRIGFSEGRECSPLFYNKKCDISDEVSVQQHYLDMLKAIGIESTDEAMTVPILDDDKAFAERFFREHNLEGKKVVALIPATTWPNKHWRKQAWAEVADTLTSRFDAVGILLGSKADTALVGEIMELSSGKLISAAGVTTLRQAAALIERSRLSIAVDTGLMHASVALEKPTVGLFGPSIWRKFALRPDFIRLTNEMSCSPCHRHPTCDDYPCIWGITAEQVVEASAPYLLKTL